MTDETVVAVYDTAAHAEAAAADLASAGIPGTDIGLNAGAGTTTTSQPARQQGFWAGLFGGEPGHDTAVYDRSMSSGSTVVTVKTPETHVTRVLQILESHNPIDIDERAAGYGLTQTSTAPTAGATGRAVAAEGGTLQLAEESLVVGKRLVNRGGTRVRRYVVEMPVEEQVTLHDEKVVLERRPVTDGRPASDSFSERAIEMTATAEEPVVGKTARVVEEVGLRKEAADHVETVRDTVRKEQVEVEKVPGAAATTATTTPGTPKI